MAVDVSAFTVMAKSQFQIALQASYVKPYPAEIKKLIQEWPSTTAIETYPYMCMIPRLRVFRRDSPAVQLAADKWTIPNKTYRQGPVVIQKETLDDDQIGMYLQSVGMMPEQAQKDVGYELLASLADGANRPCFDGTNFFASSHNVGSGNNVMTANNDSNDGVTHKMIAVITDGSTTPLVLQNREPLKTLNDNGGPESNFARETKFWADTRFGIGLGAWFSSVINTLTDTPTLPELSSTLLSMFNRLRTFTLPKGAEVDTTLYFHENWTPKKENLTILCSLQLATLLETIRDSQLIAAGTGGGVISNYLYGKFEITPTSSLGA